MSTPRVHADERTPFEGRCAGSEPKLCECGCGQPTRIAPRTTTRYGHVKGQPVRFIQGHHTRCCSPETRAKLSAAKRGKPSTFLGKHHTSETRAKLRALGSGRRQTPETVAKRVASRRASVDSPEARANKSASKRGERNPMYGKRGSATSGWKGGITPANAAARMTQEYRDWRGGVFDRDDFTCQDCGTRGGRLHAHHIKSFAGHIELRTALENGVTLCEPCHQNAHSHERARTTQTTARRTTCVAS